MSCSQISSALAQALVIPIPSSDGGISTFIKVGLSGQFYSPLTTGKTSVKQDINDVEDSDNVWKNYKKNLENTPFCTDQILRAVGLKELGLYKSMGELKKNLAITSVPVSSMLAPALVKLLSSYRRK